MAKKKSISDQITGYLQVRCSTCKKVFFSGILGLGKSMDNEVKRDAMDILTANREIVTAQKFEPEDILRKCECKESK